MPDEENSISPAGSGSPRLSVVIVSDSEAGEKDWKDEIACVEALNAQDFDEDFDILISENNRFRDAPKPAVLAAPNVRFIFTPAEKSAALKDAGVEQCNTAWVIVLDADCLAAPDWLRLLMTAADENPGYDVFTGRTNYGEDTSRQRILNLLDRSYGDLGHDGPTRYIPNNGGLYRTAVIKNFPYPDMPSPFCSPRERTAQLLAAGIKFYFVHGAVLRHNLEDDFVSDFRRHHGFGNLFAYPKRNVLNAVRALGASMRDDIESIALRHRRYLRWRDWPLGLFLFFRVRIPEMQGLWECLRGADGPQHTHFR